MITLDTKKHEVDIGGEEVHLKPKEFAILTELVRAEGKVLTRDDLFKAIWKKNKHKDCRIVDQHVCRMRKSLGDAIRTVITIGYKIRQGDVVLIA